MTTPADPVQSDEALSPSHPPPQLADAPQFADALELVDAIAALPIAGVPELLRDGPNALVLRDRPADGTAGDPGRVFHLPKHESAAEANRRRVHLLPYLRGHLSPAIPLPREGSAPAAPWGFTVAPWLPGRPFPSSIITEANEARLADAVAQFLAELHAYPAARAQALGVSGLREWRTGLDGLRRRSLSVLRPLLGINEMGWLRRWWGSLLTDDAWAFEPALTHADLQPAHLLIDIESPQLQAVLGWSGVTVADPAIDFAAVAEHYGPDFAWLVLEAYRRRGGAADAAFLTRVRRQAALFPLLAWDRERHAGESPPPEATQRLLGRLRRGPALSSG